MSMKNSCEIPPNKEKKLRQVLVSSCFIFIFIFASFYSLSDEEKTKSVYFKEQHITIENNNKFKICFLSSGWD